MHRKLAHTSRSLLLKARAHGLRHSLTPTEELLWNEIRAGKLGVAVKRQVVIGRFIADFVVPAARLVIEVDGGYHAKRRAADARRDRVLARLGYRVLRLDAELVRRALPEAVARVREALRS